mgnify:CR=1 FL=1
MKLLLVAALLLVSSHSEALVMKKAYMTGKIFDLKKDIVTLDTKSGHVNVQRKFFKNFN